MLQPRLSQGNLASGDFGDSEDEPLLPPPVSTDRNALSKDYTITVSPWSVLIGMLVFGAVAIFVTIVFGANHTPAPAVDIRVGRLPFMGYNTWNAYHCDINENLILDTAKYMKSLGFLDVGYDHVNLDDCYSERKRNSNGDIVANKARFPSGMNNLTSQIHALGLKAGIVRFSPLLCPPRKLIHARACGHYSTATLDGRPARCSPVHTRMKLGNVASKLCFTSTL